MAGFVFCEVLWAEIDDLGDAPGRAGLGGHDFEDVGLYYDDSCVCLKSSETFTSSFLLSTLSGVERKITRRLGNRGI
jgi:hypothetical protein